MSAFAARSKEIFQRGGGGATPAASHINVLGCSQGAAKKTSGYTYAYF